jgi:penicillin-binding protein 1C
MKLSGVSRMQSEQHYGLALVLGGGEVTMQELATMYAVLANGGKLANLRYVKNQSSPSSETKDSVNLLSPEAAYITLEMLRQTPRPDTASPAMPQVAWKTGTSWGFRDAWTAGVFGRYVLVVWAGNFDGTSNPALIGVEAAAPLFLRIVDALRAERLQAAAAENKLPANLRKIEVCAATGGLPDGLCPVLTQSWFIAGRSPIANSQLHRKVWIDPRTGKVVCPDSDSAKEKLRELVVEDWGTDMQKLFSQAGLGRRSGQQANQHEGCSESTQKNLNTASDASPVITSPLRGVQYALRASKPEPLVLRAEAAAGARTLYWFANDALVGKTKPGVGLPWLPPTAGDFMLRVVDDLGSAQERVLSVVFVP